MVLEKLKGAIETLNVPLAAVANLQTGDIDWIGTMNSFQQTDLMTTLFGDAAAVELLGQSLEGQLLPRIWGQGRCKCVVCKPNATTLVGLFTEDEKDAVQTYHWSKKADQLVCSVFLD